jgi:hypothetical protein
MTNEEKIELNKKIRAYSGENPFLQSLQRQLKSNKYLEKIKVGNRDVKVLSEKQYIAAKSSL